MGASMELILKPYRNLYAAIAGRSSRTQYWIFTIYLLGGMALFVALFFGVVGVSALTGTGGQVNPMAMASGMGLLLLIWIPLMPWFYLTMLAHLALSCRRMHDQDRSAWFLLFGIIPYLGWLVVIVFMFLPGTSGANRYGPDPREPDAMSDVFS